MLAGFQWLAWKGLQRGQPAEQDAPAHGRQQEANGEGVHNKMNVPGPRHMVCSTYNVSDIWIVQDFVIEVRSHH